MSTENEESRKLVEELNKQRKITIKIAKQVYIKAQINETKRIKRILSCINSGKATKAQLLNTKQYFNYLHKIELDRLQLQREEAYNKKLMELEIMEQQYLKNIKPVVKGKQEQEEEKFYKIKTYNDILYQPPKDLIPQVPLTSTENQLLGQDNRKINLISKEEDVKEEEVNLTESVDNWFLAQDPVAHSTSQYFPEYYYQQLLKVTSSNKLHDPLFSKYWLSNLFTITKEAMYKKQETCFSMFDFMVDEKELNKATTRISHLKSLASKVRKDYTVENIQEFKYELSRLDLTVSTYNISTGDIRFDNKVTANDLELTTLVTAITGVTATDSKNKNKNRKKKLKKKEKAKKNNNKLDNKSD